MAIKEHEGHRSRVRERVRRESLRNFYDYQVLEYALSFVIPYKDTNPIAHRLINKFGSLSGVFEASEKDIANVEGMGEVSAHFITHIIDLYQCYQIDKAKKCPNIFTPHDGFLYFKELLGNKLVEEIYVVCLSPKGKLLSTELVADGSTTETVVSMRNITEIMAKNNASSIIVAHNHPKGSAIPSEADNKFTKALVTTLAINGCHLLDHIIIGEETSEMKENYYSYRQNAVIDKYIDEIAYLIDTRVAQPRAPYYINAKKKYARNVSGTLDSIKPKPNSKLKDYNLIEEVSDEEE